MAGQPNNDMLAQMLLAQGGGAPAAPDANARALAQMLAGQPPILPPHPNTEALRPTGSFTAEGRPVVIGEDGRPSTERTVTVVTPQINNGAATNIPSIYTVPYRGRNVTLQMDEPQSANMIASAGGVDPNTGIPMQGYPSLQDAIAAALMRTDSLNSDDGVMQAQPGGPVTLDTILRAFSIGGP